MGRETRILLALLGLLVGVFLGVVSLKLFVPRPPAGAGPDVHADIASVTAQDLVEPPELLPPATAAQIEADDVAAGSPSRFAAPDALPPDDPFVRPASFDALPPGEVLAADDLLPPADPVATAPPAAAAVPAEPPATALLVDPPPAGFDPPAPMAPRQPPATLRDSHIAQPGDSWWSVAERAYGDGRLYRALFAWNRALDPRVSLAAGTRLEVPGIAQLAAAWPGLMPQD
jgi:5'-nucleotidase/UDP-sugar diphosphatase